MSKMYVHRCENCGKHVDVTQSISKGQYYENCPYCNNRFKLHAKETEYMLGNGINSVDDLNSIFDKNNVQEWVNQEMKEI